MRNNKLATGSLVSTATLALLLVGQTASSANWQSSAPMGIQALGDMKIFAAQSRSGITSSPTEANAVAVVNASSNEFTFTSGTIVVEDSTGTPTASYTISNVTFGPWQHLVIHSSGFTPSPMDGQALVDTFGTGGGDAIGDNFTVTLSDTSGGSNELDRLGVGIGSNPEGNAATPLSSATDGFNACLRRDMFASDTNNNAADFELESCRWGTTL